MRYTLKDYQTDAADRIPHSRLVVIGNTFNQEKLEPGCVYFLNSQTLALHVVLDEAHRGMKTPNKTERTERTTIVQRLVNGARGVPPVPIVWGISATVQRFDEAMARAENRTTYPPVVVDPVRVQESGPLKDDIRIDFPTGSGRFDTVLLARAARKARDCAESWRAYAEAEGLHATPVHPLLVVQVPNTPPDSLLRSVFATIRENWPELEADSMAHVFGDHAPIELENFAVPHVSPETVQDREHIRVLFAKDAISTGWDCPRAEVLVSFRPASDETHITQLLGRMVRTPLARRVPGNDLLNSVECLLPYFDRTTAAKVAKRMLGDRERDPDGTGGGAGRRVLLAPVHMKANPAIPASVWQAFDALPSQTLPRRNARPVARVTALALALARDGLKPEAQAAAYERLFAKLDGLATQHRSEADATRKQILEVEGQTLIAAVVGGEVRERQAFVEAADERSVEAEFARARRILTAELARRYVEHLAPAGHGQDDDLFDAHVQVAALSQVAEVPAELDREADELAATWFDEYRVAIKRLTDERQTAYDEIRSMATEPQMIEIKRPHVRSEETEDKDGQKLPTRTGHLMCDAAGNFPVGSLNQWEIDVLDREMKQPDFLAWYRNPSRPSGDALAIAYRDARDKWRRMCPDFLLFQGGTERVNVSIVDPHGTQLADALMKLRGLAEFAEAHGDSFHRIESVARMADGHLRVLDLKVATTRAAVSENDDPGDLYGSVGSAYH